jgi:hypothetical protein
MIVFCREGNTHFVFVAVLLFHCISYEGPHRVVEQKADLCVSELSGSAPYIVTSSLKTVTNSFCFDFHTVNFVLCVGITNKCINSYQFIISLSCSYMFWQLCAILRELVCNFWVTCQCGFCLIKFCVVCGCVYNMWRPGAFHVTQKVETSPLRIALSCLNM